MATTSDPLLHRVEPPHAQERWSFPEAGQPPIARTAAPLQTRRSLGARVLARAMVLGVAAVLILRTIGGWIAEPLTSSSNALPTWNVEIASTSASATLALAYSRESGVHLLRIPGNSAEYDRRVIPAKIVAGELHLLSLGLGQLDVRGRGPHGSPLASYSATARVITVFDHAAGTGVRTTW